MREIIPVLNRSTQYNIEYWTENPKQTVAERTESVCKANAEDETLSAERIGKTLMEQHGNIK